MSTTVTPDQDEQFNVNVWDSFSNLWDDPKHFRDTHAPPFTAVDADADAAGAVASAAALAEGNDNTGGNGNGNGLGDSGGSPIKDALDVLEAGLVNTPFVSALQRALGVPQPVWTGALEGDDGSKTQSHGSLNPYFTSQPTTSGPTTSIPAGIPSAPTISNRQRPPPQQQAVPAVDQQLHTAQQLFRQIHSAAMDPMGISQPSSQSRAVGDMMDHQPSDEPKDARELPDSGSPSQRPTLPTTTALTMLETAASDLNATPTTVGLYPQMDGQGNFVFAIPPAAPDPTAASSYPGASAMQPVVLGDTPGNSSTQPGTAPDTNRQHGTAVLGPSPLRDQHTQQQTYQHQHHHYHQQHQYHQHQSHMNTATAPVYSERPPIAALSHQGTPPGYLYPAIPYDQQQQQPPHHYFQQQHGQFHQHHLQQLQQSHPQHHSQHQQHAHPYDGGTGPAYPPRLNLQHRGFGPAVVSPGTEDTTLTTPTSATGSNASGAPTQQLGSNSPSFASYFHPYSRAPYQHQHAQQHAHGYEGRAERLRRMSADNLPRHPVAPDMQRHLASRSDSPQLSGTPAVAGDVTSAVASTDPYRLPAGASNYPPRHQPYTYPYAMPHPQQQQQHPPPYHHTAHPQPHHPSNSSSNSSAAAHIRGGDTSGEGMSSTSVPPIVRLQESRNRTLPDGMPRRTASDPDGARPRRKASDPMADDAGLAPATGASRLGVHDRPRIEPRVSGASSSATTRAGRGRSKSGSGSGIGVGVKRRKSVEGFGEEEEDEEGEDHGLVEVKGEEDVEVLEKRRRNTEAARRSRQKKVLKLSSLEHVVKELEKQNASLTVKVAVLETEKSNLLTRQRELSDRVVQLEEQLAVAHQSLLHPVSNSPASPPPAAHRPPLTMVCHPSVPSSRRSSRVLADPPKRSDVQGTALLVNPLRKKGSFPNSISTTATLTNNRRPTSSSTYKARSSAASVTSASTSDIPTLPRPGQVAAAAAAGINHLKAGDEFANAFKPTSAVPLWDFIGHVIWRYVRPALLFTKAIFERILVTPEDIPMPDPNAPDRPWAHISLLLHSMLSQADKITLEQALVATLLLRRLAKLNVEHDPADENAARDAWSWVIDAIADAEDDDVVVPDDDRVGRSSTSNNSHARSRSAPGKFQLCPALCCVGARPKQNSPSPPPVPLQPMGHRHLLDTYPPISVPTVTRRRAINASPTSWMGPVIITAFVLATKYVEDRGRVWNRSWLRILTRMRRPTHPTPITPPASLGLARVRTLRTLGALEMCAWQRLGYDVGVTGRQFGRWRGIVVNSIGEDYLAYAKLKVSVIAAGKKEVGSPGSLGSGESALTEAGSPRAWAVGVEGGVEGWAIAK
ncbi:hypothetical protein HK101_007324 [Irineochytrium annulatum]|nr:hypothetical protein HK101_007324 [Irineochytrium annulatum]